MGNRCNDQQMRALEKFGIEGQMQKTIEELAELIQPISKALIEIRNTGSIKHETALSIVKERFDVGYMLPQLDEGMRLLYQDYDKDLKVVESAEFVRMEDRLNE